MTDEWESRGVKKGSEYAILTDEITKAWAGLTTREYKELKDLEKKLGESVVNPLNAKELGKRTKENDNETENE